MKFTILRLEYSLARERENGPAFFIDVEGIPETLEELDQFGGKTRETLTLAECEARGISLPDAINAINADMAKRVQASQALIMQINEDADAKVREAEVAKAEAETAKASAESRAAMLEQRAVNAELRAEQIEATKAEDAQVKT